MKRALHPFYFKMRGMGREEFKITKSMFSTRILTSPVPSTVLPYLDKLIRKSFTQALPNREQDRMKPVSPTKEEKIQKKDSSQFIKAQRISQSKGRRIKTQMQAHKTFSSGKVLKNTPPKIAKSEKKKK